MECLSKNNYDYLNKLLIALMLLLNVRNVNAQLPIVHLYSDNTLSTEFTSGSFCLDDTIFTNADIRYRGASALNKTKKSFAIKLKTENGDKLDTALLGMRSDNSWILDAMAIDVARMRNRVSMDLWNDFSSASYIKSKETNALNGTRGRFVELYLNDEYRGLYCLSEKIDRKQLKLKKNRGKELKGALYKSFTWSTLFSQDDEFYLYDNSNTRWNGWEISYPEIEPDGPADWGPLSEMIHWLSYAKDEELSDSLLYKIDIPVWQDYFLLMEFICAEDNICKNQYVYFYNASKENKMLGVAPWDMDHSWGRDYGGRITSYTDANHNLITTYNQVGQLLINKEYLLEKSNKERYAELRLTFFEPENLKSRFKAYFTLFKESGAASREQERWSGIDGIVLDFEAEQEYICEWIDNRTRYMDKKYDYIESFISNTTQSPTSSSTAIFNMNGQLVRLGPSLQTLPHGIYLINGKKLIK